MAAWRSLVFSAKQLVWLLLAVFGSGAILLVPIFVGRDLFGALVAGFVRSFHSASSLLLVLGALAHAVARLQAAAATARGLLSGGVASAAVGLAALSGAMLVASQPWSTWFRMNAADLRHVAAIFHYGYSAAIALAVTLWHTKPTANRLLPPFTMHSGLVLGAITVPAAALAASSAEASVYTTWLVPPVAGLAAWSLLAPTILTGAGLLRRRTTPLSHKPDQAGRRQRKRGG